MSVPITALKLFDVYRVLLAQGMLRAASEMMVRLLEAVDDEVWAAHGRRRDSPQARRAYLDTLRLAIDVNRLAFPEATVNRNGRFSVAGPGVLLALNDAGADPAFTAPVEETWGTELTVS